MNKIVCRYGLFILLLVTPKPLAYDLWSWLVVWNVGQGQWVTLISEKTCQHFDMGGDRPVSASFLQICRSRTNALFVTHYDFDHIGQIKKNMRLLDLCLAQANAADPRKIFLPDRKCPLESSQNVVSWIPKKQPTKDYNSLSQIFLVHGHVLITGDSPKRKEKIWSRELKGIREVDILVVGHHGSRTSTSENLLQVLPRLNLTVASSRHSRYGHPHAEVIARLQQHHVPLLTTEKMGNIAIRLN